MDHHNIPVLSGISETTYLTATKISPQRFVNILVESPPAGGVFDMKNCSNFDELAAMIYQTVSELKTELPAMGNNNIENPVPGYKVAYFTNSEVAEEIYPQEGWERFVTALDSITVANKEPAATEEPPAPTPANDLNIRIEGRPKLVTIVTADEFNARTLDISKCNNFAELAAAIYSKVLECKPHLPANAQPNIENPVPGCNVAYFTDSADVERIYPQDGWERFVRSLDHIFVANEEPAATEEAPAHAVG